MLQLEGLVAPGPVTSRRAGWALQGLDAERLFYGKRFIITLVFAHRNNFCRANVADCRFGARKVRNADGAEREIGIFSPPSGRQKIACNKLKVAL
jgi:hypothetical protein